MCVHLVGQPSARAAAASATDLSPAPGGGAARAAAAPSAAARAAASVRRARCWNAVPTARSSITVIAGSLPSTATTSPRTQRFTTRTYSACCRDAGSPASACDATSTARRALRGVVTRCVQHRVQRRGTLRCSARRHFGRDRHCCSIAEQMKHGGLLAASEFFLARLRLAAHLGEFGSRLSDSDVRNDASRKNLHTSGAANVRDE